MTRENYKNWEKEAEWDLDTAKILKEQGRHNSSAFYAQQSVEKLVKAVLMFKNESPWGHSTRELILRLSEIINEDLSDLIHLTSKLDLHYIPSRYPNAHPDSAPHEVYDEEMAEEAIDNAQQVFNDLQVILTMEQEALLDDEADIEEKSEIDHLEEDENETEEESSDD